MNLFTDFKEILDERTVSSFGISIGTGIALESMFTPTTERYDDKREIPNELKVNSYGAHIINVYTLARNIVQATLVKDKSAIYESSKLLDVVIEEIYTIAALYEDTKCDLFIFQPDYSKPYLEMNVGKKKILSKDYIDYVSMKSTLSDLSNKELPVEIIDKTFKLPDTNEKVLITTHYPIDLLNSNRIYNLLLLESHTGKLKSKTEWYSKYHKIGTRSLNVFPFLEQLIYLLGDGGMIKPVGISIRVALFNLATDKKWSMRTTYEKFREDIKSEDLVLKALLNYRKIY